MTEDDAAGGAIVLNETIHQPTRLRIMTMLVSVPETDRLAYGFRRTCPPRADRGTRGYACSSSSTRWSHADRSPALAALTSWPIGYSR